MQFSSCHVYEWLAEVKTRGIRILALWTNHKIAPSVIMKFRGVQLWGLEDVIITQIYNFVC